jgi:hypothetical protein
VSITAHVVEVNQGGRLLVATPECAIRATVVKQQLADAVILVPGTRLVLNGTSMIAASSSAPPATDASGRHDHVHSPSIPVLADEALRGAYSMLASLRSVQFTGTFCCYMVRLVRYVFEHNR